MATILAPTYHPYRSAPASPADCRHARSPWSPWTWLLALLNELSALLFEADPGRHERREPVVNVANLAITRTELAAHDREMLCDSGVFPACTGALCDDTDVALAAAVFLAGAR